MQDFTPRELARLVASLSKCGGRCLDMCSGTGALTIAIWNVNKDIRFVCEELSKRAIPILLFNLAIRNITGIVREKDVLENDVKREWHLEKGVKYSTIQEVQVEPFETYETFDVIVSNPPYSVKWNHDIKNVDDPRFMVFGYPPKQYSDYAFIIDALNRLEDNGEMFFILPHGVLFRGNGEANIRELLVKKNLINTIIGLPDKLFLNTSIPVCIINFKKTKSNSVLFIDASREYEQSAKLNKLTIDNIYHIKGTYAERKDEKLYSHVASLNEIERNQYNLNIPRYVDTYVPEPLPDINKTAMEYITCEKQIRESRADIVNLLDQLTANDEETEKELNNFREMFRCINS
jgi:type I restriction enzyme M protein